MNDAQLRQQPRDVRDEFEKINDSEVDRDKQIVGLKLQLDEARAKLHSANQKHDRIRAILGHLQSDIDQARNQITEIDAQRAEVIATALITDESFSADEKLITRRLDLERQVERLTIARPALESRQRVQNREISIASEPCTAIEKRITDRRDTLKLMEARRRHGYA